MYTLRGSVDNCRAKQGVPAQVSTALHAHVHSYIHAGPRAVLAPGFVQAVTRDSIKVGSTVLAAERLCCAPCMVPGNAHWQCTSGERKYAAVSASMRFHAEETAIHVLQYLLSCFEQHRALYCRKRTDGKQDRVCRQWNGHSLSSVTSYIDIPTNM